MMVSFLRVITASAPLAIFPCRPGFSSLNISTACGFHLTTASSGRKFGLTFDSASMSSIRFIHQKTKISDHGAIITHERFWGTKKINASLLAHDLEHLTQARICANATCEQDFMFPVCATARSVTSTSIAKAVSWKEWHTSGKGCFLRIPALLLSIPKMKNPCLLQYMAMDIF